MTGRSLPEMGTVEDLRTLSKGLDDRCNELYEQMEFVVGGIHVVHGMIVEILTRHDRAIAHLQNLYTTGKVGKQGVDDAPKD